MYWNPIESGILDSHLGFQIPGSGHSSLSMELGFQIPIVNRIPDSLSFIPDSKAQDSGLHKQNFLRFRIPQANIS